MSTSLLHTQPAQLAESGHREMSLCALSVGQKHPLVAEPVLTTSENLRKSCWKADLSDPPHKGRQVIRTSKLFSTLHIFTLFI